MFLGFRMLLCLQLCLFGIHAIADDSIKFMDETRSKFKGSDKDLELIGIDGVRQGCSDNFYGRASGAVVSWKNLIHDISNRKLDSYLIFFQIENRQGKPVYSGKFQWEQGVAESQGHVSSLICEKNDQPGNLAVSIPMTIPPYGAVHYWIENIQSSNPSESKKLEDHAENDAAEELAVAKKSTSRQMDICQLEKPIFCTDYSKGLSFHAIKLNTHSNIEDEVKKIGMIVVKSSEAFYVEYDIYKNATAKKDLAKMISIQTDSKGTVKHIEWNGGKWGLPVHTEGMRKYLANKKISNVLNGNSFLGVGPSETFLFETSIAPGVTSQKAGVGPRAPEIKSGPAKELAVWQSESDLTRAYESFADCKQVGGNTCKSTLVRKSDFKGKYILVSNSNQDFYVFEFGQAEWLRRSGLFLGVEECNQAREVQFQFDNATAPEFPKQTECYRRESQFP